MSTTPASRDATVMKRLEAAIVSLGVSRYAVGPGPDGITISVGGKRADCTTRKAAEQIAVVLEGVAAAGGAA